MGAVSSERKFGVEDRKEKMLRQLAQAGYNMEGLWDAGSMEECTTL